MNIIQPIITTDIIHCRPPRHGLAEDVQRHRPLRQRHVVALQAAVEPRRLGGLAAFPAGFAVSPGKNGGNHGMIIRKCGFDGIIMGK